MELLLLIPVAAAGTDRLVRWRRQRGASDGRFQGSDPISFTLTAAGVVSWMYWSLIAFPEPLGVAAGVTGWAALAAGSSAARPSRPPRIEPPRIERCRACNGVVALDRAA